MTVTLASTYMRGRSIFTLERYVQTRDTSIENQALYTALLSRSTACYIHIYVHQAIC